MLLAGSFFSRAGNRHVFVCATILVLLFVVLEAVAAPGSKAAATEKAELAARAWMAKVPVPVLGDVASLPACRAVYRASWSKFVDVGSASITLTSRIDTKRLKRTLNLMGKGGAEGFNDQLRAGVARVSTQGPVRFLWAYDCDIFSVFDPVEIRPVALHFKEVQGKKRRDYYGEFGRDRFRSYRDRELAFERKGEKLRTLTFKDIPRPLDLLSSVLYFRSLPLEVGDEVWMVTCPNEHPYLVMLKVEAHENHTLAGKRIPSIRLRVAMKSVERDGSLSEHEKFKTATVWMDKDSHRLPLEIRAEVFVGSVRVILGSYHELGEPEPKPDSES